MDGNGRMGRFLMNVMLASGGYPWTVIPFKSETTIWRHWRARAWNRKSHRLQSFLHALYPTV